MMQPLFAGTFTKQSFLSYKVFSNIAYSITSEHTGQFLHAACCCSEQHQQSSSSSSCYTELLVLAYCRQLANCWAISTILRITTQQAIEPILKVSQPLSSKHTECYFLCRIAVFKLVSVSITLYWDPMPTLSVITHARVPTNVQQMYITESNKLFAIIDLYYHFSV